jgi:hypothetical protein
MMTVCEVEEVYKLNMDKRVRIETQEILDDLLNKIEWHDSFIRELYVVATPYVYAPPDAKLLIITPNSKICTGIEFIFRSVDAINIPTKRDLELKGIVTSYNYNISLSLGFNYHYQIEAEESFYLLLDDSVNNSNMRYGWEPIIDR